MEFYGRKRTKTRNTQSNFSNRAYFEIFVSQIGPYGNPTRDLFIQRPEYNPLGRQETHLAKVKIAFTVT